MLLVVVSAAVAQERKVQNKPYIDLRPLHFGISIGLNMQDLEVRNLGPQLSETGESRTVLSDADMWNPGFSVGVLADLRLSTHFSLRVQPTMHFGSKHLVFRDLDNLNESGVPHETTQDMKNTYISVPIDLKFSAPRFNNYRPYVVAGVNPMLDLTVKKGRNLLNNRFDCYLEVGFGCDFYYSFFKFIPEIKFAYGLTNIISKKRDDLTDPRALIFSQSVDGGHSKMIIISLYFE